MNIVIDQRPLVSLLSQAQTVVEKKTNSSQLMNVYLKAQEGVLFVYATDLEVSLVGLIPCDIYEDGVASVNAKAFYEIVREMSDLKIHLVRQDNFWLDIKQDRFQSKIIGIPPEEYPLFALQQPEEWFEFSGLQLKTLIQQTEYAISHDSARSYLMGVYFEINDTESCMAATDAHRLAVAFQKSLMLKDTSFKNGIMIPKKGIAEIKKLIEEDPDSPLYIATDSTQFYIRKMGITLGIRLIEKKFPPFRMLIPKNKYLLTLNRSQIIGAIKRVALFSNFKSKAIFFQFSEKGISINTTSYELGDAVDEIALSYNGPKITITYNSKYLLDVLSALTEPEVEFHIESHERPTLIQGKGNASFLHMVMPMRL
jgi:DNA polymerase III subunit beta